MAPVANALASTDGSTPTQPLPVRRPSKVPTNLTAQTASCSAVIERKTSARFGTGFGAAFSPDKQQRFFYVPDGTNKESADCGWLVLPDRFFIRRRWHVEELQELAMADGQRLTWGRGGRDRLSQSHDALAQTGSMRYRDAAENCSLDGRIIVGELLRDRDSTSCAASPSERPWCH